MHLSVSLSACLSACLSVCLSISGHCRSDQIWKLGQAQIKRMNPSRRGREGRSRGPRFHIFQILAGGGKCRACIFKKAKLKRDRGRARRERKPQRGLKVERAGTELHLCVLSSSETRDLSISLRSLCCLLSPCTACARLSGWLL